MKNVTARPAIPPAVRLIALLLLLYIFFVSISLMGASFKFFGKDFARQLLESTTNPFVGLFIGILATSIVQSSSTTTSMTVALVAAGGLDVSHAIPIIMGANIGTSVTNTLVSVGHISRPDEFKRAFAAATIHDFFNLLSVVILFPMQLGFDLLGRSAGLLSSILGAQRGTEFANPLKAAVKPAVHIITSATGESGLICLIVSIVLLLFALRYIVVNLKKVVIGRVEAFFSSKLFKNAGRAMVLGVVLTVAVQSSSITTSLIVPLAGAGILTLTQVLPFTLGANVGTTVTAMLASLVTGEPAAVTVALAHLLFNLFGIMVVWPIRFVPLYLARQMAALAVRSKLIPLAYILIVFFLVPFLLIYVAG